MEFNQKELKNILTFLASNYPVTTFRDYREGKNVILRHDLDLNITDAFEIYKIEDALNIKSTFFVMVSSDCYNPFTQKNRQLLKKMSDHNFEIALHFDPYIYGDIGHSELKKKAIEEAKMLETITNKKVISISQHRPAVKHNREKYILLKNFKNAYDPKFFQSNRYISDSRMTFKKDIYQFIDQAKFFPIQILLHPFQYFGAEKTYQDKIKNHVIDICNSIDKDFRPITSYQREMKNKTLAKEIFKNISS